VLKGKKKRARSNKKVYRLCGEKKKKGTWKKSAPPIERRRRSGRGGGKSKRASQKKGRPHDHILLILEGTGAAAGEESTGFSASEFLF